MKPILSYPLMTFLLFSRLGLAGSEGAGGGTFGLLRDEAKPCFRQNLQQLSQGWVPAGISLDEGEVVTVNLAKLELAFSKLEVQETEQGFSCLSLDADSKILAVNEMRCGQVDLSSERFAEEVLVLLLKQLSRE